ncbi:MAG: TetR family transcriptional regulator, partial [Myxococcales bacterium]|nr:TetR family transcriptional regulator [Myxococcales bacterium]
MGAQYWAMGEPTTRKQRVHPLDEAGLRRAPVQARAQDTVAVILQAAAQLLAQSGTLTTNAVAARAGVSVG